MQLKHKDKEEFFINTAYDVLTSIGYNVSKEEIKKKAGEDFLMHFSPINRSRIHIGIWAVGKWEFVKSNPETEIDKLYGRNEIDGFYGIDEWKPYSVCVFCIHDWDYDKFRPTYCNRMEILTFGADDFEDNKKKIVSDIKHYLKNPVNSYRELMDYDEYSHEYRNKNKYVAFWKAWWYFVFMDKWNRFWCNSRTCLQLVLAEAYLKTFMSSKFCKHDVVKSKDWRNYLEIDFRVMLNLTGDDEKDYRRWKNLKKFQRFRFDVVVSYKDPQVSESELQRQYVRGVHWNLSE